MLALFEGGPTLESIIFERKKTRDRRIISFTSSNSSNGVFPIQITVNSVSRVNDGDEDWFFEGITPPIHGKFARPSRPVKGQFSTTFRKGWIEIDQ